MELSYLTQDRQQDLLAAMEYAQATPSLSQAQRIKKLALEERITTEGMEKLFFLRKRSRN